MSEVVVSVRRVTDIMSEITAASKEQSVGIEEINRAVSSMDESTQQNAALVEEAAAAAKSLQDQAAHLEDLVSRFQLDDEAHNIGESRLKTVHPLSPRIAHRSNALTDKRLGTSAIHHKKNRRDE